MQKAMAQALKDLLFHKGGGSDGGSAAPRLQSKNATPTTASQIVTPDSGYGLTSITLPSTLTSIAGGAFSQCAGVAAYHVLAATPPTLAASTSLTVGTNCIIYVPYSADHSILDAYKAATNWSTYASKMQEEPQ